jgi:hypothetical protein
MGYLQAAWAAFKMPELPSRCLSCLQAAYRLPDHRVERLGKNFNLLWSPETDYLHIYLVITDH